MDSLLFEQRGDPLETSGRHGLFFLADIVSISPLSKETQLNASKREQKRHSVYH